MAYIPGNGGPNRLTGTFGSDTIDGFGGDDILDGLGGNDFLYGGSGNDDLIGGSGRNELTGGADRDWFVMSGRDGAEASDDVIRDFQFGLDKVDVSAWGVSDFDQIRVLLRTDSRGDATFDALYDGFRHVVTLNDVRVNQLVESDFVYSTQLGRDEVGTSYADVMFGSAIRDILEGRSGGDILLGGGGDDELLGGNGNDKLYGGIGDDDLDGGSGNDILDGGSGSDVLWGRTGRDTLNGGADADRLYGGSSGDKLSGGDGDDLLDGGNGNDSLSGGRGADDLIGGAGRDSMRGGAGADGFIFKSVSHSKPGSKRDIIHDFQPGLDFIDLQAIDAKTTRFGNQTFEFVGPNAFDGAGQISYQVVGKRTIISGNVDNDSTPEFQIELVGRFALVASDFIL